MIDDLSIGAMLAEQLERLFSDAVTHAMLGAAEEGNFSTALWAEIEAMDVAQVLVPESAGGAALSWDEVDPLLRCLGRHAVPLPLGETLLGRGLVGATGLPIPAGALAVVGEPLQLDGEGRLFGRDPLVPWVSHVEHAVVAASACRDNSWHLCVVSMAAPGLIREAVTAHGSIGRIPGMGLHFDGVRPLQTGALALGELGLLPHLAVLRSAQMAGALERLLALSIDYANTRVQFGKPVGKFQAVQHLIAELAEQTAAAQVAARIGGRALDSDDCERGAAIAKYRTGVAATRGAAIAHQVFGAMGMTDEHVLHFLSRRLWQWRSEGRDEHWWAERLGRSLISSRLDLWSALVGSPQGGKLSCSDEGKRVADTRATMIDA